MVKRNAPGASQDPEVKFLFDMDLFMTGNTPCTLAAGALETLHGHAGRLFEGALTDTLGRPWTRNKDTQANSKHP